MILQQVAFFGRLPTPSLEVEEGCDGMALEHSFMDWHN